MEGTASGAWAAAAAAVVLSASAAVPIDTERPTAVQHVLSVSTILPCGGSRWRFCSSLGALVRADRACWMAGGNGDKYYIHPCGRT